MMNGRVKWNAKYYVTLALSAENQPQIHSAKLVPTQVIADSRLVITLASHNTVYWG